MRSSKASRRLSALHDHRYKRGHAKYAGFARPHERDRDSAARGARRSERRIDAGCGAREPRDLRIECRSARARDRARPGRRPCAPARVRDACVGDDRAVVGSTSIGWQRLRYHLASEDGYKVRSIGFSASDAPAERGRTIGFAVASMIPPVAEDTEPLVPARPDSAVSATLPAPGARFSGSIEVTGAVSTGIRGSAGAEGGSVGVRWFPTKSVGVRASGSFSCRRNYGGSGELALPPRRSWRRP